MNTQRFSTALAVLFSCLLCVQGNAFAQAEKKTLGPNDVTFEVVVGKKTVTCLLADGATTPQAIELDSSDPTQYSSPSKKFYSKNKKKAKKFSLKIKAIKNNSSLSKNAKKKKIAKLKEKKSEFSSLSSQKKADNLCANPPDQGDDDDDDDDLPEGLKVLNPISRALTAADIRLLLNRAGYGATSADIAALTAVSSQGIDAVFNAFLTLGNTSLEQNLIDTFEDEDPTAGTNGQITTNGLNQGLVYAALNGNQATEKWAEVLQFLFTESGSVFDTQNITCFKDYLHTFLRGNAKKTSLPIATLLKELTTSSHMLIFLNGDNNIKGKENENYPRELMELYSMGENIAPTQRSISPQANYTENDVIGYSKIFTGNRVVGCSTLFSPEQYDDSGYTVFAGTTYEQFVKTPDEFIDWITTNSELLSRVAKFYMQELAIEYMGPEYSINQDLLDDAAKILIGQRAAGEEPDLVSLRNALLKSEYFYSNAGSKLVRSQHASIVSLVRVLGIPFGDGNLSYEQVSDFAIEAGHYYASSANLPFGEDHLDHKSRGTAATQIEMNNAIVSLVRPTYQDWNLCEDALGLTASSTAADVISNAATLLGVTVPSAAMQTLEDILGENYTSDPSSCNDGEEQIVELLAGLLYQIT